MNDSKRELGIFLIVVGITIFYFGGYRSITGKAIAESLNGVSILWYYIFGSITILVGAMMASIATPVRKKEDLISKIESESIAPKFLTKTGEEYFAKRTKEIFDYRFNGQDVFVSRWELDGILDYIKNASDRAGNKKFIHYDFEHEREIPSIHQFGKHKLPHINVKVEYLEGGSPIEVKRHLIITEDPRDPRLRYIGVKEIGKTNKESSWGEGKSIGTRVKSAVYDPEHPRTQKQIYKRATEITYERN